MIDKVNESFEAVLELLNSLKVSSLATQNTHKQDDIRRKLNIAITEATTAHMWAVQAVTEQE